MVDDNSAWDAQQAAELEADVAQRHIGVVYAEAFIGVAERARATDELIDVFDRFVTEILDPFPEFEQILGSALISHEERLGLIDRVLGDRVPAMFIDFLKVVSHHDRMDCLRVIHAEAHSLYDAMRNRVPVELITPTPIDDATAERLISGITSLVGGEPIVSRKVDPELIGGAVLQVGDTIYDGSIATQLQNLCQQMIHRSADEIQSRRDRFRYPAGN